MNPPVLVTGGAGYIDSHVVLALRDCGWPVVVLGSRSAGVSSSSGSMRWREKRLANSTVACTASFEGRDGGGPSNVAPSPSICTGATATPAAPLPVEWESPVPLLESLLNVYGRMPGGLVD